MEPIGKRLMAIFAHSDDAEIWAGGTIAKWNHLGGSSKIVCFSKEPKRVLEGEAGAKDLGSDFVAIKSSPETSEANLGEISKYLENFKPDVLITHYFNDSHPDHRKVFELASRSVVDCRIKTGTPHIFLCANSYNQLMLDGVFEPNIYVDISEYAEIKFSAINRHKSQPVEIWRKIALDQNSGLGSRFTNVKFAEGYLEIPILGKIANLSLF